MFSTVEDILLDALTDDVTYRKENWIIKASIFSMSSGCEAAAVSSAVRSCFFSYVGPKLGSIYRIDLPSILIFHRPLRISEAGNAMYACL